MEDTGKFIISLDFELLWGVRDKKTTDSYGEHILNVWDVLPRMIDAFEKHSVKGTFATVGFLFASNKEELISYFPKDKPTYDDENLSPYNGHFDLVKDSEEQDKYHYASELINLLKKYPNQEIATHTFSHYYCLEKGQTETHFKDDIVAAIKIAKAKNIPVKSLVFPRNQFNEVYLKIIKELGITSYRGNESVWFQTATSEEDQRLYKRFFRLSDAYLNISGHNCYDIEDIKKKEPYNIPSSRFLRPYSPSVSFLEGLRLKRILKSMTYAAKNNKIYHLWWHPHNFGSHQDENFAFLEKILSHYSTLKLKYGFDSVTMNDLSEQLISVK